MTGFRRAIAGTAALIVGGFVVGALVGFVASAALYLPQNGWRLFSDAGGRALLLRNAAIVGAITGIATPVLAWLGLRRIAIGRVIAFGAVGAAAGALGGALVGGPVFPTILWGLTAPIAGAVVGSVTAGLLLRSTIRAARSASTPQAV